METWSYTYDDLNRLLTATNFDTPGLTQSFTYDDIGNITYNSKIGTYTYPAPGTGQPHAVQTAGSRSYVYDAAGRMTSRNGQVIQWNGDGKPSSIGSVSFVYGGTGERLKKISGSSVTRYVGGDYEIAPDGTVTKYLIGGKQVGSNFFIHHRDHLGSIQAVTDAAGVEVRRQDHTPFGDQHYAWGSHAESKGWIGEREEETELVYLNARYYDPEIGRFTAPDPIVRLGQGLNRYAYSDNNPVNFPDPTGLCHDGYRAVAYDENGNPYWQYVCPSGDVHDDQEPEPYPNGQPTYSQQWGLFDWGSDDCALTADGCDYTGTGDVVNESAETGGDGGTGGEDDDPPPTDDNTPEYDNPLYNCGNGLKENCPGKRRFLGQRGAANTGDVMKGDVVAVVASSSEAMTRDIFYRNQFSFLNEPPVRFGVVTPPSLRVPGRGLLWANKIAGSRMGRIVGFNNPVKYNRARLQPYSRATGEFAEYTTNGFTHSAAGRFGRGFGAGVAASQGIAGPDPVGAAGNLGYFLGTIVGTFYP